MRRRIEMLKRYHYDVLEVRHDQQVKQIPRQETLVDNTSSFGASGAERLQAGTGPNLPGNVAGPRDMEA